MGIKLFSSAAKSVTSTVIGMAKSSYEIQKKALEQKKAAEQDKNNTNKKKTIVKKGKIKKPVASQPPVTKSKDPNERASFFNSEYL